jgi:hypothetical protein
MSEARAAYERLLAGLESCRWDHMRVLADAAEEQGNEALALGWRWLADNRKWPDEYGWSGGTVGYWSSFAPHLGGEAKSHDLPEELFDAISRRCDVSRPPRSLRCSLHPVNPNARHHDRLRGYPLIDFLVAVAREVGEFLLARKRVVG